MEQIDKCKDNPWVQRMLDKYKRDGGFVPTAKVEPRQVDPTPAITGMDGVFFGVISKDGNSLRRDKTTPDRMRKHGYDPTGGIEQIRFRRPMLAKGLKDCLCACAASNEPVITFFVEHLPLPQITLIKMSPLDEDIAWVAIDLQSLASTVYDLFTEEVHEALQIFEQFKEN